MNKITSLYPEGQNKILVQIALLDIDIGLWYFKGESFILSKYLKNTEKLTI